MEKRDIVRTVRDELMQLADPEKKKVLSGFFKTGVGWYGEGDQFVGIPVPLIRSVAKRYYNEITIQEVLLLLSDPVHECRLLALLILVLQFPKAGDVVQREIFEAYLSHTNYINNWDLVDLSAYQVVGRYLEQRPRDPLYRLAQSSWLWDQRISIVATWEYIRKGDFEDTLRLSDQLLKHPHDLIQKAVGWMLREVGKRDKQVLVTFLQSRCREMPRTMLRYAIEKFDSAERTRFLIK